MTNHFDHVGDLTILDNLCETFEWGDILDNLRETFDWLPNIGDIY
jgi:hypothetical protein